jgi:hypothetical protein
MRSKALSPWCAVSVRKSGGQWVILGQNLHAEVRVTSGIRRMSTQQAQPLRAAGCPHAGGHRQNRWCAFWDAPLLLPNSPEMAELRAYTAPRAAIDPVIAARGAAQAAERGPVGAGFGPGQAGTPARGRGAAPTTYEAGGGLPPLPLAGRNIGEPRSEKDIRRATATFATSSCGVKTDGATLEVTFPGLTMGIFG